MIRRKKLRIPAALVMFRKVQTYLPVKIPERVSVFAHVRCKVSHISSGTIMIRAIE